MEQVDKRWKTAAIIGYALLIVAIVLAGWQFNTQYNEVVVAKEAENGMLKKLLTEQQINTAHKQKQLDVYIAADSAAASNPAIVIKTYENKKNIVRALTTDEHVQFSANWLSQEADSI